VGERGSTSIEQVREAIARAVYTAIHIRRWDAAYPEDIAASYDQADAALAAIEAEGAKVVFREPTEEMLRGLTGPAGYTSIPLAGAWAAMFDAAPNPLKE
jgi:hypothetical protein